MRYVIEVTAEDIANGNRGGTCDCPIALAVARITGLDGSFGNMDIDGDGLFVMGSRRFRRASNRLPESAREFIARFDVGLAVEPISFSLTVFNWCLPEPRP